MFSKVTARQFFTGEFLAQLERLTLVSKRTFRGQVRGERKSPQKGISIDFCDYRHYEAGDDPRYVDWNIYGRLDRLYVKLFLDEKNLCVHLLLDASASMDFGNPSKFQYGTRLAAALGFVGLSNLERVGVGVFRNCIAEAWPPHRGRNQFLSLLDFLRNLRPGGPTEINDSLSGYARRAPEPGLAILISDLLDPVGYQAGLRALQKRGFDIHVLHLLSPEEMNPASGGDLRLIDAETGEIREVSLDGEAHRSYLRRLSAFLEEAKKFCRTNGINYHRLVTDSPLEAFMLRHLRGKLLT
jgi:uncharacterized protein (DUF58 family)